MLPEAPETDILPLIHPHVVAVVAGRDAQETVRSTLKRDLCEILTTDRPDEFMSWLAGRRVSLALVDSAYDDQLSRARSRSPETSFVLLARSPDRAQEADGVRWVVEEPWPQEALRRIVRHLLREQELARRTRQQAEAVEERPEERELGVGD